MKSFCLWSTMLAMTLFLTGCGASISNTGDDSADDSATNGTDDSYAVNDSGGGGYDDGMDGMDGSTDDEYGDEYGDDPGYGDDYGEEYADGSDEGGFDPDDADADYGTPPGYDEYEGADESDPTLSGDYGSAPGYDGEYDPDGDYADGDYGSGGRVVEEQPVSRDADNVGEATGLFVAGLLQRIRQRAEKERYPNGRPNRRSSDYEGYEGYDDGSGDYSDEDVNPYPPNYRPE